MALLLPAAQRKIHCKREYIYMQSKIMMLCCCTAYMYLLVEMWIH